MDSKKLTEDIASAVDSIGEKERYAQNMEELLDISRKLPPKDFFIVTAQEAVGQSLSLTLPRHVLAVPSGECTLPGEKSSIEQTVFIKDVFKRLDKSSEFFIEESERLWLDILQGFLVQDERVFVTSAVNKSKKVVVDGLNDPKFIRYVEEHEDALPGQHMLILTDDGIQQTLASSETHEKLERNNIGSMFDPAVRKELVTLGIFGKFGEIVLFTDMFRYDVLRVEWPEGLLGIGVGPTSEVGAVDHRPVEIRWNGDRATLVREVHYYDFLKHGECISFWQKGRTVG